MSRLFLSGVLPAQKQQELIEVANPLDPIRLFQQVALLQQAVFRYAASGSPFVSPIPSAPICVFSVEDCTAGPLQASGSAADPAAAFHTLYREQEQIFSWLVANPEWSSGDISRELQCRSPGRYHRLQIRAREPRDAENRSAPGLFKS